MATSSEVEARRLKPHWFTYLTYGDIENVRLHKEEKTELGLLP